MAAAEALLLAQRSGLDLGAALRALMSGAGTSRMLEVGGPLMINGEYGDATMRVRTFRKDTDLSASSLERSAATLRCSLSPPSSIWPRWPKEHGDDDTASVFAVLQRLAGSPG